VTASGELHPTEAELRSEMTGRVDIRVGERRDVVRLPVRAVTRPLVASAKRSPLARGRTIGSAVTDLGPEDTQKTS